MGRWEEGEERRDFLRNKKDEFSSVKSSFFYSDYSVGGDYILMPVFQAVFKVSMDSLISGVPVESVMMNDFSD